MHGAPTMHWLPAMVQAAALVHKHHREAWKFCIGDTWERHTFGSNSLGCFKSWGCFSMFLCCVSLLVFFGFRRHVVILGWVVLPIFIVNFSLNRICWIHYDMNYTFGCIWYPSYWGNMPMWNDVFVVQRRIFGRTTGPGGSEGHRRFDPSKRAPAGDFAVFLYWTNGVAGKHGKIRPFKSTLLKNNFRVQAWFSWWRQHYHGA